MRKCTHLTRKARQWLANSYEAQMVVLLACVLCLMNTTGCRSAVPAPMKDNYGPDFATAVKTAQANAANDELPSTVIIESISLHSEQLSGVARFAQGKDGRLCILDAKQHLVSLFARDGTFLTQVGNKGTHPGEYLFPSDVSWDSEHFLVSDFTNHRVNRYDLDGRFEESFIYTGQRFSATRIFFDSAQGDIYLFGNRWKPDPSGNQTADLVHRYGTKGQFKQSALSFPPDKIALNLLSYDTPFVSDGEGGDLFIVLPFQYKIYRLTNEAISEFPIAVPSEFKEPIDKLAIEDRPDRIARIHSWELKWTPIVGLAVLKDKLLIEYQTFNPLRYTLDVWSIRLRNRIMSIHTNRLLLGRGLDSIYLLNTIAKEPKDHYELLKTTF